MPFAVFRQHQRKLLGSLAILAMIGFVLSDTMTRWGRDSGAGQQNTVVAELFGKRVRRSDLAEVRNQRVNANRFLYEAGYAADPTFFGGYNNPELIDALILEREADRLKIPRTAEFARTWIEQRGQQLKRPMNAVLFELILSKYEPRISGEQLLAEIAAQLRISMASQTIAVPLVTPLDVFRNYRDQNERASFKVVPFPVEYFTSKVGEPSDAEVNALFDKYKDTLPDPSRPTPGFKVPRMVKVEFLEADLRDVAKRIKAKLPEADVKAYYEANKSDYKLDGELPDAVFLGAPELTPPRYQPLSDIRDSLADALARERAAEQVRETFDAIRDEFIAKFADQYGEKEDELAEARKEGYSTEGIVLPKPNDLAGVAKKYELIHEITPSLDRREAARYGQISRARSGTGRGPDAKDFATVAFEKSTKLFEPFELDDFYLRYLCRKVEDEPAHVADPKDPNVRAEVVRAWKRDKARPLAEKAAQDLAAKLKAASGVINGVQVDDRPVVTIGSATKLKAGMPVAPDFSDFSSFNRRGPATPTDLPEVPEAGPKFLESLFALKPGQVAVEPDQPLDTYYVMTLEKRVPVPYSALMGPNSSLMGYLGETQNETIRKATTDALERLRKEAGYKPEDFPAEAKDQDDDRPA